MKSLKLDGVLVSGLSITLEFLNYFFLDYENVSGSLCNTDTIQLELLKEENGFNFDLETQKVELYLSSFIITCKEGYTNMIADTYSRGKHLIHW